MQARGSRADCRGRSHAVAEQSVRVRATRRARSGPPPLELSCASPGRCRHTQILRHRVQWRPAMVGGRERRGNGHGGGGLGLATSSCSDCTYGRRGMGRAVIRIADSGAGALPRRPERARKQCPPEPQEHDPPKSNPCHTLDVSLPGLRERGHGEAWRAARAIIRRVRPGISAAATTMDWMDSPSLQIARVRVRQRQSRRGKRQRRRKRLGK